MRPPGSDDVAAAVRAAADLLAGARDVTLLAHVAPDADALGSALALGLALRARGARARVSFGAPDRLPESLAALAERAGAGLLVTAADVPATCDLLVVLDTGSPDRLGPLLDRVDGAGAVLVVDHHASNVGFGTHQVIDPAAEATVVLVARLLAALGVELDEPVARCLYAGLVTDTVSFRTAGPAAHRLAARLLAVGVDGTEVVRPLLDSHPFCWFGVLATVLARARLEPAVAGGLGMVHTAVRLADASDDGPLRVEEVDGVVELLRTAVEAEVAVVLKEVAPGRFSASLRAKGRVDVSVAATALGGGGHRAAAGFTVDGPEGRILADLRRELDRAPRDGG